MSKEYTKGPWRVEEGTTLIWGACDPDDTSDRGMGYPITECKTSPGYSLWAKGPTADEGEANARLIAAAPDLFEACVALDVFWTESHPEGPDGNPKYWIGTLSDKTLGVWRAARAAIAKARGE